MAASFWRWWWRTHIPAGARLVAAVLLGILILVCGYALSGRLTETSAAGSSAAPDGVVTTVTKVVTVRSHDDRRARTVVRRQVVPVSRTVTAVETRVVTSPGRTREFVRYVSARRRPAAPPRTIVETRLVPTVQTRTVTRVQPPLVQTVFMTTTVEPKAPKPPPPPKPTAPVTVTVTETVPVTITETVTAPRPPKH
jgi:hypothetical protein